MSPAQLPDPEPQDEALIEEQEEAAAAEAARVGGVVPPDEEDPARQPLVEAGEGESEGFELAEKDLREAVEEIKEDEG
jgi:hypothetical protein